MAAIKGSSTRAKRRISLKLIIIGISVFLIFIFITVYNFSYRSKAVLTAFDMGLTPTPHTFLTKDFGFHEKWHPGTRMKRFPSYKERLHIYMSNWYAPVCSTENVDERIGFGYSQANPPFITLNNVRDQADLGTIETDYKLVSQNRENNGQIVVALHEQGLLGCRKEEIECQFGWRFLDFAKSHFPQIAFKSRDGKVENIVPIITKFGSNPFGGDIAYPYFCSFRDAASVPKKNKSVKVAAKSHGCTFQGIREIKNALETVANKSRTGEVLSPIIWDLYDLKSTLAPVLEGDMSWDSKLDKAVWRGELGGHIPIPVNESMSFEERCKNNKQRCQLVLKSVDSLYVDAGISQQRSDLIMKKDFKHLLKGSLSIEEQLKYKIVIVAEGEGFARSLAWALYSGSVVIMPKPTKTTYLMEERLEPWIHYIAVKDDWSNLEKKVKWCIQNSNKARKIAERGSLWIHDLYMDDNADIENNEVGKEMLKRYLDFFVKDG